MPELPDLDPVVHAPLRLGAMTLLTRVVEAEFTWLRDSLGATDGNVSVHLGKLESAGYVSVSKRFLDRKPRTFYQLTPKGLAAYRAYLEALRALIGPDALPPT